MRPAAVFYTRATGPYPTSSAEAWDAMSRWLDRHRIRGRIKQGYGYCRDNPRITQSDLLRFDACVPVLGEIDCEPEAGIKRQTLPGGAYAVYTHIGGYSEAGDLFSQLHRDIIPRRGLTVDYDRPFLAHYLNDPLVTRSVHRRTELCVPVLPVHVLVSSNDDQVLEGAVRTAS